jgi:hypothetical protein
MAELDIDDEESAGEPVGPECSFICRDRPRPPCTPRPRRRRREHRLVQIERDKVELLTARPGGEIRTPNLHLMFDVTKFRASA